MAEDFNSERPPTPETTCSPSDPGDLKRALSPSSSSNPSPAQAKKRMRPSTSDPESNRPQFNTSDPDVPSGSLQSDCQELMRLAETVWLLDCAHQERGRVIMTEQRQALQLEKVTGSDEIRQNEKEKSMLQVKGDELGMKQAQVLQWLGQVDLNLNLLGVDEDSKFDTRRRLEEDYYQLLEKVQRDTLGFGADLVRRAARKRRSCYSLVEAELPGAQSDATME